ncbi:hypothetical protein NAP1_11458 [Erythrobacter sp. NAP1]|uniref:glycosyltransferase family 2 protein n=1 Tax=Erythrobacter sp. NAP1 TaxID=237727 RepID=UPI00006877A2|nr:glycosyltransferase family 2 protein [Erythrobacter sp. NAP1]EAQ28209.1 hypothetical protein NAP1_11458 [Erythrobacter sp. NAP1]
MASTFASTSVGEKPTISVLVVAYNSADVIDACLRSIAPACRNHSFEVLFVDNGDGSTEARVADDFPWVQIVPSQGNVGFAAGNNLLAAHADGEYLLLLNPDAELEAEALDALMHGAKEHHEAAAWGGVTLNRDGQPDLSNTVCLPSLGEMASRVVGRSSAAVAIHQDFTRDARVDVLSGSFVMFSRSAWDEVGGLDASYFLYSEEVDLFYRLGQKGYSFWRIGKARGYHDLGHGEPLSETRLLYRAAGTMQFARLHWSKMHQLLAFLLLWAGAWQRYLVGLLIGSWKSHYRLVGTSHRSIALRPSLWRHGYHPIKGLLAQTRENVN